MKACFGQAWWIGLPTDDAGGSPKMRCGFFRLRFHVDAGDQLRLYISAHSRYRLLVNGCQAAYGPCKGDRWRHYFEELDITHLLQAGQNVLALQVVSHLPYEAQHEDQRSPHWACARALGPAIVLSGQVLGRDGCAKSDVSTGIAPWESLADDSISWRLYPESHWMGSMERVDGARFPHGWEVGADRAMWSPCKMLWRAEDPALEQFGIIPTFPLAERSIPLLYEAKREFAREMPLKHDDLPGIQFENGRAFVPAFTCAVCELDVLELTKGFFRIAMEGGKGARIVIRYAESYSRPGDRQAEKGKRDDAEHYALRGHADEYLPSGGSDAYQPFWVRVFRFVRIEVTTAVEPMMLNIPHWIETGYPLEIKTFIDAPETWVSKLWEMSVRTLKRCMHETYEDCPYYEQLQYVLDARLEILFTYAVSGDVRMAKRAIEDFHCSKHPCGLLQARFPTQEPLIIPPFSLHWISMVLEYFKQTGDVHALRRYRSTVDGILEWYEERVGVSGLVERLEYWDLVDWIDAWEDSAGRTPAAAMGAATVHNLMYAHSLQEAAELNEVTGRAGIAAEYRQRAERIVQQVEALCWDPDEGLYREGPECYAFSQHSQVYAVLCGLKKGKEGRDLMERALKRTDIARCSFAQQFFLFRALEACGAYALTEQQWEMWKGLIDKNLTTIPEIPDGNTAPRSDCHGWSALPLYEFTHCLLGVKPGGSGWSSIVVAPHPLSMRALSGTVVTPHGDVHVAWSRADGLFAIDVRSPEGVPLALVLPDGQRLERLRGGNISARCVWIA